MLNQIQELYTPEEFKQFMKTHPCRVRYSINQRRLLIAIVNTKNDILECAESNCPEFNTFLNIAYQHAKEYTATIKSIKLQTI